MTTRTPWLALAALLVLLLPACGSTGGGGSKYITLRDGERAESAPDADVAWSLAVSGTDVTLEVDGRVLVMGDVAASKRVRYALNPGGLYMVLQITGQPQIVVRPGSFRVGTKTHALPHPGRHAVDLGADPPY